MLSLVETSKHHSPTQPATPQKNWPDRKFISDHLFTSIIHDLRNPLAAICASAEMLTDRRITPDNAMLLGRTINKAAGRMRELLADLTGVMQGRLAAVEDCSLQDVLAAACEDTAIAAGKQRVDILLDLPARMELKMMRSRIERVFINLIANALEAMPKGGKIRISARSTGGFALIAVEDTGPGIPPEIFGQLFAPFVTGKKEGLGLGLALSRQTVRDHGGDIWVEPGDGAHFVIRLPMANIDRVAS